MTTWQHAAEQAVGITVAECVDWAADVFVAHDLFFGHGTDNAHDEAVALLAAVLGYDDIPFAERHRRLRDEEHRAFIALVDRRVHQRLPAAYLTRRAVFAGLWFYVDERVLVPRSPIASCIVDRFSPWLDGVSVTAVLDVCTGSGCIGIACADVFTEARVVMTDISADALAVARTNCIRHGVADRVHCVRTSLLDGIDGAFPLIVANPPYLTARRCRQLPTEYQREPDVGLVADDDDGLSLALALMQAAATLLTTDGILVLEVGEGSDALYRRLPRTPLLELTDADGVATGVFVFSKAVLQQANSEMSSV